MRRITKSQIRRALQNMGFGSLSNPASLQLSPTPTGWKGTAYNACGPCPEHVRQTYHINVIGPCMYVTILDPTWHMFGTEPIETRAACRLDRQRTRWTFYYSALDQYARY